MINNKYLPIVALAGRPNVGKSTLFNRLLHKRRAITDPTPGVTRDPVAMDTVILERPLKLVDTGGFKLDRDNDSPEGNLERVVVERTLDVLKRADVIVLLFEAGELTLEDEEFIGLLRPYRNKLLAAVNKTEGGRREAEAWNLLSYGFEKVYMISAEHGDNIRDLEEAIAARLDALDPSVRDSVSEQGASANAPDNAAETSNESAGTESPAPADVAFTEEISAGPVHEMPMRAEALPEKPSIRVALLGKPNTGKSTLSNRLTSSTASIVSDIPGTTRDVVEGAFVWKKRNFEVLDTAGIRRKTKVSENIEYYSVNHAIKTIDEADIIFLIIDAQEGLTDQDKKIAALAHDRGRGLILVLNKWDTMPEIKNTFEAVQDRIHFLFGQMEYAPIIPLCALDGNGIDKLLNTALRMYDQLTRRIETSALNHALEQWLTEHPPPSGPQTRFKIRYAVQKEANPVSFVFFASRPHAVSESYVAYLRNRIRKDLGFSLVPLSIELRPSSKSERGQSGSREHSSHRKPSTSPRKKRG